MSDKHYIGLDLIEFENTGEHLPVSRVTLFVDDEQSYTAGDDTGKEISAFCPSATQAMADALLQRFKGFKYQSYTASSANVDPAAELGDGATVGGIYSLIAQVSDTGTGYSNINAPGEAEIEEEYPYVGPLEREFNRKMVQAYSLIEKTSERITLEVGELKTYTDGALGELEKEFGTSLGKLEGDIAAELEKYSTIEMTNESIEFAVSQSKIYTDAETGKVVASLKNYSTIEQTNSSISAAVTSVKEYTNSTVNSLGSSIDTKLKSYSTIEMTDASIEFAVSQSKIYTDSKTGEVQASLSNYSTITQTADSITTAVTETKQYVDGKYASLSSEIEQTAESISLWVEGLDKGYTELKLTVDGVTVTDSSGTTRIKGSSIETGSLVLTGVITFSDLDAGLQTQVNSRGISADQATTLITSTLVSSPNIRGANYWAADGNTWMNLLSVSDLTAGIGGGIEVVASGLTIFSAVRDGLLSAALTAYNHEFLRVTSIGAIMPIGNWDFSAANTNLTATFG